MNDAHLRSDVEYLAGHLPHRKANTVHERSAAEYIRDRFRSSTVDTEIDDFYSLPGVELLFAAYYAEFSVVALLAVWWPWIAFGYGLVVFSAYLGEFTGYDVLGRFWPQYETQNVVARFMSAAPRRLLVVTAHYDSPRDGFLDRFRNSPWPRRAHLAVVAAMVVVLGACAAQGLGVFQGHPIRYDYVAEATALFCLLAAAGALVSAHQLAEPARGAHNNASGVAALLSLAERVAATPPQHTDVWLVATGSKETGLHGMRRLVGTHDFDRETTYFLNVEQVGSGPLTWTIGEGMLHVFRSAPDLVDAAEDVSQAGAIPPRRSYGLPSDALIPLARGFKAIGLTGAGAVVLDQEDRSTTVDLDTVRRAVDAVDGVLRGLDARNEWDEAGSPT